jgi:hypothetical protein
VTRWQRFRHAFVRCRGPVYKTEYRPPTKRAFENVDYDLARELLYGVTLTHCRCSVCGKTFTNRTVGDARSASSE